jgi:hypothetical protein
MTDTVTQDETKKMIHTVFGENSAWAAEYPAEAAWLVSSMASSDFARSLVDYIRRKGGLTERQLAAVQRNLKTPEKREVDLSSVEDAFATALANGLKRPKVRLADYVLSLAGPNSVNAGAIYVTTKDGCYMGKVKNGTFYASRECREESVEEIADVLQNPAESAIAYGKRVGKCACCGRELTNSESIALGIGPICAARYGWA